VKRRNSWWWKMVAVVVGAALPHVGTLHTGRLKKQTWVEKTSVRALVTCDKTPTTVI